MSLLQLPSELICIIAGFVTPEGIESFTLSCRRIYLTCNQQLQRHRQMKQKWHKITVGTTPSAKTTLHLALDLMNDPGIALYIEDANMLGAAWNALGHDRVWELQDSPAKDMDPISDVRKFLLCALGSDEGDTAANLGKWFDRSLTGSDVWCPGMLDILVMALLPNVKRLTLPRGLAQNEPGFVQILRHVIRHGSMGSCLQSVRPCELGGDHAYTPLQAMLPLMELKSVEQLYICSAVASDATRGGNRMPFRWENEHVTSRLVKMELASCCMGPREVSALLAHTPLVKSFRYAHETKWGSYLQNMNFAAFVAAIGEHLGNTLIDLAVTIDNLGGRVSDNVVSMREFLVLRTVEVDVRIFGNSPITISANSANHAGLTQQQGRSQLPNLAKILPRSIRSVTLNARQIYHLSECLFNYTPQTAHQLLPVLEHASLRYVDCGILPDCVRRCGVALDKLDIKANHGPIWRQAFRKQFGC